MNGVTVYLPCSSQKKLYNKFIHCKNIWVILTLEMVTSVAPCVRALAMLL